MPLNNLLTSLKSAWADWRILLAARDDLDDDYNFASGPRRGAHLAALDRHDEVREARDAEEEKPAAVALSNASSRTASASE